MKNKLKQYLHVTLALAAGILVGWLLWNGNGAPVDAPVSTSPAAVTSWTCSMHPQIRQEKPGKCPLCAMDLIPVVAGVLATDPAALHLSDEAAALADV
ncbi:MAG: efflux RND transporter periplasmic adaptor subunit, partial [Odoribacteraceae bacterium]|nr:efflux RND transporter periplasmic adaptor subunit [Odoribacteraceae bacterium]